MVECGASPMPAPQSEPAPCPGWTSTASSRTINRIEQRVVQVIGQPARLVSAEQIRATNGADEERVAGKDASGSIGFAHEQRDVLGRVAGRMQYVDCDVPDAQRPRRGRFVKGNRSAAPGPATTCAPTPRARGHRRRNRRGCAFRSHSVSVSPRRVARAVYASMSRRGSMTHCRGVSARRRSGTRSAQGLRRKAFQT